MYSQFVCLFLPFHVIFFRICSLALSLCCSAAVAAAFRLIIKIHKFNVYMHTAAPTACIYSRSLSVCCIGIVVVVCVIINL